MLAHCSNHVFTRAVFRCKQELSTIVDKERVLIDSMPLTHGMLTGILISGLGPDVSAPGCYSFWRNSDLAGGVYTHPRLPGWYTSTRFEESYKSMTIFSVIERYFSDIIDLNSPREVLRAIWHIHA